MEPERGPCGSPTVPPCPSAPLEPRLRRLEEELALVRAALADALRRLGLYEQHLPGLLRLLPRANGAIPEPCLQQDPDGLPPGPPQTISVGTQTEGTAPMREEEPGASVEQGVPQEPPPPGSPPCPPAPAPASPEPPAPDSPTAAPSLAPRGAHKELLRRHSSSSGSASPRQRLSRKAASSANLLLQAGSPESRPKEPTQSPGTRRGNYNLEGVSVKMFLRGRPITMYVPSGLGPYGGLRTELPPERLQLDWVYGYRGRDSRSNLHVLASGELIYFMACVVVLLHVPLRRQRHYLRHSDCVRCLAVHPDRLRVATGQAAGVDKDGKLLQPVVHIWDSATLLTLQQIGLGSFERGVGSLAFSSADHGAFLCVVDDSNEHMMSVWDCARGTKLVEVKSTNESVLAVEFNPQDSSSIITSGKSHIYFWTWSGATLTKKQGIFGKYKKPKFIQCFIFNADGDVLTGDSEGNILTWTRVTGDGCTPGKGVKETYQIGQQTRAHEGSIFTLCHRRDGTVLSGGGKDRRVVCWSPALALLQEAELPERFGAVRTIAEGPGDELLVGTTRNALLRGTLDAGFTPIVQGHTDKVWGLATHPSCCLFLTCGHDRQLCLWDGQEHALAWSLALEDTGLCADFHPGGQLVAVGLLTGRWLVLDMTTQQPLAGGSDGNEQLSVVRFSPDGSFLAIGSHDNFIYIYSVTEGGRKYTRFGRCTGTSLGAANCSATASRAGIGNGRPTRVCWASMSLGYGLTARTAPTSTPCAGPTTSAWWLWPMTSAKFISSSTPAPAPRRRATCTGATAATSPTCASPTTTSTSSRSGARTPASSSGECWGGQHPLAAAHPAPPSPLGTPTRDEPSHCFLGCFLHPLLILLGTNRGGGVGISPPPPPRFHAAL
ncbi:echinoderm microtubule-associated protein-like 3 isoform X2 [Pezoporus flaviventris]|uniref:echinoderm microtubule-associated protein-like 3 isoform X2 n=1 Tax=Pezoporus flaviventris TaxID=889875 RepID=UPI002AAF563F|nr:echinoderm microtubule-associated protein-like 3 isoform X2 [Pezoporus flaviventris]